ncbi:MAG TPA: DUF1697 domain-containing protein [Candidatus Polarisedimenticolia bacterium]|nr:DUF1697 domain-containing protein [Candidatus Polarisedimenticolia bacterium]
MSRHVALLRAVNLGAHNKVAMADLRLLCERLDLREARTLLQSGNLVFEAPSRAAAASLERRLEKETGEALGVHTDFFVRSAAEWNELIESNPFGKEAKDDPGHLLVMCLKKPARPAAFTALEEAIRGRERVRAGTRHAYFVYPDGVGRSRLTTALIESKLGTRGTARNWNTVLKLRELLG